MNAAMLSAGDLCQILDRVIQRVTVSMMNDDPFGKMTMNLFPYISRQWHPDIGFSSLNPVAGASISTPVALSYRADWLRVDRSMAYSKFGLRRKMNADKPLVPSSLVWFKCVDGRNAFT